MSINNPLTDPTLDPVTGIPLDASYATQYQVPLGSQPINLEELNAQGKQSNWLYPDNLPPVVARLQARDLTNPGNAQDLSTDGKRNLNVNINALNPAVNLGGGGGVTPAVMNESSVYTTSSTNGPFYNIAFIGLSPHTLYGYSVGISWAEKLGLTYNDGSFRLFIQGFDDNEELTLCYGQIVDFSVNAAGYSKPFNETVFYPVPRDITSFMSNNPNGTSLIIEGTHNLINIAVRVWSS